LLLSLAMCASCAHTRSLCFTHANELVYLFLWVESKLQQMKRGACFLGFP
jgi:hypothetical protein